MFLPGMIPKKTAQVVKDTRALLREIGKPEDSVKFIAGIFIVVDETDEKAQARFNDMLQYADLEGTAALFGGWSGTGESRKLPTRAAMGCCSSQSMVCIANVSQQISPSTQTTITLPSVANPQPFSL